METTSTSAICAFKLQIVLVGLCLTGSIYAQSTQSQRPPTTRSLKSFNDGPYKKWINEDVLWIITPEEKAAYAKLSNPKDQDQFIEQFWLSRDPTPGTPENEYKEEHYRRIAYANQHFAASVAGWKTDRGRIYIVYGPPDEIKDRPVSGNSGQATQVWHYQMIPGQGRNVDFTFVDICNCGDFRMAMPKEELNRPLRMNWKGTLP
jgi:GWxTD domain-containing protein